MSSFLKDIPKVSVRIIYSTKLVFCDVDVIFVLIGQLCFFFTLNLCFCFCRVLQSDLHILDKRLQEHVSGDGVYSSSSSIKMQLQKSEDKRTALVAGM